MTTQRVEIKNRPLRPVDVLIGRVDAATETARFIAKHGGPIGFCDNPNDLSDTEGIELQIVAIITGNKSRIPVAKGKKPVYGSALIVLRTKTDLSSDFQIVPNDSGLKDAQHRFRLSGARKAFPEHMYQMIINAIHTNLEHRRATLFPKRKTIYSRPH